MVIVVVDSLPLDSIPFTIVAVVGVSSHDDRLPPRFCNTTTSLSGLPPTISLSLCRSADFLTLSSPFQRLDHAVSAFPSSFSCCLRLSHAVSASPLTFSLPVSPTLYKFSILSYFLSSCLISFCQKKFTAKTSVHVTID